MFWATRARLLHTAGVVGPIVFALAVIYFGAIRPEYDAVDQFISELAERGSSTEHAMRLFGFYLPGVLVAAYGFALFGPRGSSTVAVLVIASSLARLVAGAFPCDTGCPFGPPFGPFIPSSAQSVHNAAGAVGFLTLPAAALVWFFQSRKTGRSGGFAWYSLASGILGLMFLVLLLINATERNSVGLLQRLSSGVLNAWLVALAIYTWPPAPKHPARSKSESRRRNSNAAGGPRDMANEDNHLVASSTSTPTRTAGARLATLTAATVLCVHANAALAHHSYTMFDTTKSTVIAGSVAKLEWVNPHVFLWIYVEKPGEPGKFDLYAFEAGSIGSLTRAGWTKDTFHVGEKLSVHYFALKDGRTGGQVFKVLRADGTQLTDPFSPQARRELGQ